MSLNDVEIFRGDSCPFEIKVTEIEETEEDYDLTGCTLYFTAKLPEDINKFDKNDDVAKIRVNVTSHTNPTEGESEIILSEEDTNIKPGEYYYDIQLKDATGKIITILAGKILIKPDITRRI